MLGGAKGCAIKIDRIQGSTSLAIGKGLESPPCQVACSDIPPAWAVGSAGAIASFLVIDGIEQLFIFAENDTNGRTKRPRGMRGALDCCGQARRGRISSGPVQRPEF